MDNGNKSEEISRPVVRLPILIGLLVLVLIYLSVTLPNMDEKLLGYPKMKRSQVLGNMRTCQIAAEAYAQDHSGLYPETINDKAFRSYFPGGSKGFPYKPGLPPINPVTKQWNTEVKSTDGYDGTGIHQWPVDGKITDVIVASQQSPSQAGKIGKGMVEYSAIFNSKREPVSFAIRGGDMNGQAIANSSGKVWVWSKWK